MNGGEGGAAAAKQKAAARHPDSQTVPSEAPAKRRPPRDAYEPPQASRKAPTTSVDIVRSALIELFQLPLPIVHHTTAPFASPYPPQAATKLVVHPPRLLSIPTSCIPPNPSQMMRTSLVRVIRPLAAQRTFSTALRAMAEGDTGGLRTGGERAG